MPTFLPLRNLIPCKCAICDRFSSEIVCPNCANSMRFKKNACFQCGEHLIHSNSAFTTLSEPLCGQCVTKPPPYEQTIFAFEYSDAAATLVKQFKFKQDLLIGEYLASSLVEVLKQQSADLRTFSAIIPIPLHPSRLKTRGFNQSLELAKIISKQLGVPIHKDYLIRVKHSEPQAGLNKVKRIKNIKGAFALQNQSKSTKTFNSNAPPLGGPILLIDDVITTGTTIREASKLLQKRHKNNIIVCSIARTFYQ